MQITPLFATTLAAIESSFSDKQLNAIYLDIFTQEIESAASLTTVILSRKNATGSKITLFWAGMLAAQAILQTR